jgi:hypothetical protein
MKTPFKDYFDRLADRLSGSNLGAALRDLRLVNYHGRPVIVSKITGQDGPVFFDGEITKGAALAPLWFREMSTREFFASFRDSAESPRIMSSRA